jgi:hypothetical protein
MLFVRMRREPRCLPLAAALIRPGCYRCCTSERVVTIDGLEHDRPPYFEEVQRQAFRAHVCHLRTCRYRKLFASFVVEWTFRRVVHVGRTRSPTRAWRALRSHQGIPFVKAAAGPSDRRSLSLARVNLLQLPEQLFRRQHAHSFVPCSAA